MEYAFSLAKHETLHVDDFLKLDGDSGYLIGRNLIVCDECRRNVYLNKGDKIKPYFSHFKENDAAKKVCSRRVKGYTEHYVRQLNKRRSKLRIGYFQQRFEDLVFLAIINLFEKNNKYFAVYGALQNFPEEDGVVLLKINEDKKIWILDHLRQILKLSNYSKITNIGFSQVEKYYKSWIEDLDYFQDLFKKSQKFITKDDFWSKYEFNCSEQNYKFAEETLKHLVTNNARPLFNCLYIASVFFTLSLSANKLYHFNVPNSDKRFNSNDVHFLGKDWISSFLQDKNTEPRTKNLLMMVLIELDRIKYRSKDGKTKLEDIYSKFLLSKSTQNENGLNPKEILNSDKSWYGGNDLFAEGYRELVGFSLRIFSICDLAEIARRNYGDDMNSPDELLLNSTAKNRGFIYIAWSSFGKAMWQKQLNEKSFNDAVKIGKSDDPERRKKQLEANFAPPDSVEIIDYYPVLDMTKAENFVHNKLKKFRLSSNREVFGLEKESAKDMLEGIMANFYNKLSQKD